MNDSVSDFRRLKDIPLQDNMEGSLMSTGRTCFGFIGFAVCMVVLAQATVFAGQFAGSLF